MTQRKTPGPRKRGRPSRLPWQVHARSSERIFSHGGENPLIVKDVQEFCATVVAVLAKHVHDPATIRAIVDDFERSMSER